MQTINIKNLEANEIIRKCVHCGFCLATCPTYQLLGSELDSPRGRVYLIKSALENNKASVQSLQHLDRCLTCRSCETTCPSGVQYGRLLDIGRALIEHKRPLWQKVYRLMVRKFLTTPPLFNTLGFLFQHSKVQTPIVIAKSTSKKVLLLGGCVQPTLAPNINHSVKNILAKLGYQVQESTQNQCCGAIDQHLNANHEALQKIKKNIDTWNSFEVIISSASGCGMMVKDYASFFAPEDAYYQKAQAISKKTQDIAQFLAPQDLSIFKTTDKKIAYHSPCTMQHGQKLAGLVESILSRLGYILAPTQDAHLCCGSAGTYSIFEAKISKQLKTNKLKHLSTGNPEVIVTANIGCLIHLQKGTKIPVKHWIELLNG